MKGPGRQYDMRVLRVFRCAACGRQVQLPGRATSSLCSCADPPKFMQPLDRPKTVSPDVTAFLSAPDPDELVEVETEELEPYVPFVPQLPPRVERFPNRRKLTDDIDRYQATISETADTDALKADSAQESSGQSEAGSDGGRRGDRRPDRGQSGRNERQQGRGGRRESSGRDEQPRRSGGADGQRPNREPRRRERPRSGRILESTSTDRPPVPEGTTIPARDDRENGDGGDFAAGLDVELAGDESEGTLEPGQTGEPRRRSRRRGRRRGRGGGDRSSPPAS